MLTLKNTNKINSKKILEKSILESQNLIESLDRHDLGFNQMINDLVGFYNVERESLLNRLVNNLSNYDLSKEEISFGDLESMSKLSALSLIVPEIKPVIFKNGFEELKEFDDDSYQVDFLDLDHLRQVA